MEENHRNILREGLLLLLENLKVHRFVDIIYSSQEKVLSDEDYEKILAQKTESDKIRQIVLIMPRSGPKAFDLFIQALRQSGQTFIAEELLKESRNDFLTDSGYFDSQATREELNCTDYSWKSSTISADSTSGSSDLTGFIHQVQQKCQSARGNWYLSFVVQTAELTYQRCLTFFPDLHKDILERYATTQIPVCLKDCSYYVPTKKGKYKKDTIKIDSKTEFENAEVRFAYKPPPFTRLADIDESCLNLFLFIKVKIFEEGELTKRPKHGKDLYMQEKHVRDEHGSEMKLTAWQQFVHLLRIGEWYELNNVSVKMFEGTYKLSTSSSTSAKPVNLE